MTYENVSDNGSTLASINNNYQSSLSKLTFSSIFISLRSGQEMSTEIFHTTCPSAATQPDPMGYLLPPSHQKIHNNHNACTLAQDYETVSDNEFALPG
jgi:hypothetical protein